MNLNFLSKLVIGTAILTSSATFATPQDKADASAINAVCSADATTAGCTGEVVGKGLLRCLHQYKKAQRKTNRAFAYSAACESAIQKLRSDKQSGQ